MHVIAEDLGPPSYILKQTKMRCRADRERVGSLYWVEANGVFENDVLVFVCMFVLQAEFMCIIVLYAM